MIIRNNGIELQDDEHYWVSWQTPSGKTMLTVGYMENGRLDIPAHYPTGDVYIIKHIPSPDLMVIDGVITECLAYVNDN